MEGVLHARLAFLRTRRRLPAGTTILFKQLVYRALAEDWIGESKAAELLGIPVSRFHQERKLEAAGCNC